MTVDHYNIDTLLPTAATIFAYSGYYITLLVLYDTIIHHESEKKNSRRILPFSHKKTHTMHFPISKSTKTVHKIVSLAQYAGSQLILKCNVYTWCTRCPDIAPFSMVAGGGVNL